MPCRLPSKLVPQTHRRIRLTRTMFGPIDRRHVFQRLAVDIFQFVVKHGGEHGNDDVHFQFSKLLPVSTRNQLSGAM